MPRQASHNRPVSPIISCLFSNQNDCDSHWKIPITSITAHLWVSEAGDECITGDWRKLSHLQCLDNVFSRKPPNPEKKQQHNPDIAEVPVKKTELQMFCTVCWWFNCKSQKMTTDTDFCLQQGGGGVRGGLTFFIYIYNSAPLKWRYKYMNLYNM